MLTFIFNLLLTTVIAQLLLHLLKANNLIECKSLQNFFTNSWVKGLKFVSIVSFILLKFSLNWEFNLDSNS